MVTMAIRTDASLLVQGPPQGQWSYADWEMLPDDDNRYEIINGVLYMTKSPSSFHQYITLRLYRYVGIPAEDAGLVHAFVAPIGVLMPGCDPVQPDFILVKTERASIIRDKRIYGPPDLIVEILSPGSRDYDESVKLTAYAAAEVPEYGVVDPETRELRLYRWQPPGQYGEAIVFREADTVHFACLPGIEFVLADLFAGAPDTTL